MSKEAIKNLLMDFMADYAPNKWSNDDVYEKYAEKIDNVRSMGEIIAFTELTKKVKTLEAKLAESEYKVQTLLKSKDVLAVTDIAKMSVDNFNLRKENKELKQQLAEKENIIVEQKIKIRALSEENFLLKDDVQMAIKMQNKHDIEKTKQ